MSGFMAAGAGRDGSQHQEGRCANPTSGLSRWLMETNIELEGTEYIGLPLGTEDA